MVYQPCADYMHRFSKDTSFNKQKKNFVYRAILVWMKIKMRRKLSYNKHHITANMAGYFYLLSCILLKYPAKLPG